MLVGALAYAERGWNVFPVAAGGKVPAIAGGNGHKDATTNPEQIHAWWEAHPNWNVGIACESSGLFVVDVDAGHGGEESLLDLRMEHGSDWLNTPTVLTPGGGAHYYFRAVPEHEPFPSRVGVRPGIDIRARGGYVVAPPSLRSQGAYYWATEQSLGECLLQPVPAFVQGLYAPVAVQRCPAHDLANVIPLGARNAQLTSLAGSMRRRGLTADEMLPSMLAVNERCQVPLEAAEVQRVADSIGRYAPADAHPDFRLTDIGNAERLVARHRHDLRYCRPWGKWLVWDGRSWTIDQLGLAEQFGKETVRSIYEEASDVEDEDRRKSVAKHAQRSEGDRAVKAMLSRAESEPAFAVQPSAFDRDPWLFNCLNGTIDLRTGQLRKHRPEDLITKLAPVRHDATAQLQRWDDFVAFVSTGDLDLADFLQRYFGYCLTGSVAEEKLAFVHGRGGTGKSTFIEAIKSVFGSYGVTADFETFLARKATGGPRPDIARLAGARLVTAVEVDDGKRLAEGLVKQLTGGDTVTARELYAKEVEFVPQFKLVLVANHAPTVHADDEAIWRRVLRLPFDNAIPQADQDSEVKLALRDPDVAGPAILAWLVRGCLQWQREGLGIPRVVTEATQEYRSEMDHAADFFDNMLDFAPRLEDTAAGIYYSYKMWCADNGVTEIVSIQRLGQRLKERGCTASRLRGGVRAWKGVAAPGSTKRLERRSSLSGDAGDEGDGQIQKPPFSDGLKGTSRNPLSPSSPSSPVGEGTSLSERNATSVGGTARICPVCGKTPTVEGRRCFRCEAGPTS